MTQGTHTLRNRKIVGVLALAVSGTILLGAASCTDEGTPDTRDTQAQKSKAKFDGRQPPNVTGDAEYNNYINAQEKIYDDPANIIWCTGSFGSANSPIFTVPIAGKLTSSSVSYYSGQSPHQFSNSDGGGGVYMSENQSVDGMYHGSPAPYRYGFTPGGQYVEFAGINTFCTTALTKFQRTTLEVAQVDDTVTKKAEQQLKDGDKAGAQATVDGAATSGE